MNKGTEAAIVLKDLMVNRDPSWNKASVTVDDVYTQRRLELWGEGFALYDHLRLKKGVDRTYAGSNYFDAAKLKIEAGDWKFLYQIPLREIQENESISEDYNPVFDSSKLAIVETGEALGNYGTALKLSMKTTSNNALDTVIQQGIVLATSQDQLDLIHGVVYPSNSRKVGETNVVTIKELEAQKEYYYCAYAQNREGVAFGEAKKLTTDKAWDRAPVVYENFSTTSFLQNLAFINLGADDGFQAGNVSSWELGLVNDASFAMLLWSIDGNTGALLAADDLIECTADFTDGVFPEFTFLPYSYGAMPVQTSDIYFDSFEIIASESPIETKEQADAAKIYYKATLNKDTVNKMHTVDLSDFENKVCYIYIRHKAEKTGYALMISHVEANALFAPIE